MPKSLSIYSGSEKNEARMALPLLLLTGLSFLFVSFRLFHDGTNIVTETYRLGSLRLFEGDNPYRLPLIGGDRYEYSPFFALFYGIFAYLPAKAQALAWSLFNSLVFWIGILSWLRIERKTLAYFAIPILLCSMELNISLLYQQINASLIGVSLFALALIKREKFFWGAALLMIATNVKPLPLIFFAPLLLSANRSFWLGSLLSGLFCLFAPALIVGVAYDLQLHLNWFHTVFETMNLVRYPQLDIGSVVSGFGFPDLGQVLRYAVLFFGGGYLVVSSLLRKIDWTVWIPVAALTILLASPRSESPTFVFMAPVYVLLLLRGEQSHRAFNLLFVLIAGCLTTLLYTDVWPKGWVAELKVDYLSKTMGTTLLWGFAVLQAMKSLVYSFRITPGEVSLSGRL